ncbi:rhodanese-like domain-containing protein [Clostridium thermobutyricum]|uniref:Putative adenylyltransferase/sulfurtransferase MoeZ n=1 Tax=Clostridium thermobutyricum DSM 4928 TaxID=1121339 RepID=A0A1V4SVJ7_9CLOT|nr:rhodanese-like domain-containing protein [Clostridium thermobutyricum]OPX47249.1 putative adenylyltransferase/sulfurtransferase MoeZ [Clostridium thermobutyricum DSM 4928]
MKEITALKLKKIIETNPNTYIIDVRDRIHYDAGHIKNSINVPLYELEDFSTELPTDKDIYVICKVGNKSSNAVLMLNELGFENCINVRGGMLSYDGITEKTVR